MILVTGKCQITEFCLVSDISHVPTDFVVTRCQCHVWMWTMEMEIFWKIFPASWDSTSCTALRRVTTIPKVPSQHLLMTTRLYWGECLENYRYPLLHSKFPALGTTSKKKYGIFNELFINGFDPSPPPPINEIFNDEISPLFLTPSLPQVIMKYCADVRLSCQPIFCDMKHLVMQKPYDMWINWQIMQ